MDTSKLSLLPDYAAYQVMLSEDGLTMSSANHVANIAKENLANIDAKLENLELYSTSLSLIGQDKPTLLSTGVTAEQFSEIPRFLAIKAEITALIAWIRESIKGLGAIKAAIDDLSHNQFSSISCMKIPERPTKDAVVNETSYKANLSANQRLQWIEAQAMASVYGEAIHPNGEISKARKKLLDVINKPNKATQNGRDTLIESRTPTVDKDIVEKVFFDLQSKQREFQTVENKFRFGMETQLNDLQLLIDQKYQKDIDTYKADMEAFERAKEIWKKEANAYVSKLRITIPERLNAIYTYVVNLGK